MLEGALNLGCWESSYWICTHGRPILCTTSNKH